MGLIQNKKLYFFIKDRKIINTIEQNLLSASNSKKDINCIILNIATGLLDNLKFIKKFYFEIYKILDSEHSIPKFLNFYSYTLDFLIPNEKDDIQEIIIAFSDIVKLTKENNNKPILNYNDLFNVLFAFYSSSERKLSELYILNNFINLFRSELQ